MANNLICPIMSARVTSTAVGEKGATLTPTVVRCQEDQCAWWEKSAKKCAVVVMGIKGRRK